MVSLESDAGYFATSIYGSSLLVESQKHQGRIKTRVSIFGHSPTLVVCSLCFLQITLWYTYKHVIVKVNYFLKLPQGKLSKSFVTNSPHPYLYLRPYPTALSVRVNVGVSPFIPCYAKYSAVNIFLRCFVKYLVYLVFLCYIKNRDLPLYYLLIH